MAGESKNSKPDGTLGPVFEATFGPNGEWGDVEDIERTELFKLVFTREDFGQLQAAGE